MKYISFIILSLASPFFINAMENSSAESVQKIKVVAYGQIDSTNYSQCIGLLHSIMVGTCELDGNNLEFCDSIDTAHIYATPFKTVHLALSELMGKDNPLNLDFIIDTINASSISSEQKQERILSMLKKFSKKNLFQVQLNQFTEFYHKGDLDSKIDQALIVNRTHLLGSIETANADKFKWAKKLHLSHHPIKPLHEQIEALVQKYSPTK